MTNIEISPDTDFMIPGGNPPNSLPEGSPDEADDPFSRIDHLLGSADRNRAVDDAPRSVRTTADQVDIRALAREAVEVWESADEANGSDEVMQRVLEKIISRLMDAADDAVLISRDEAARICKRLEHDASWDKCGSGYYRLKKALQEDPANDEAADD